MSTTKIGPKHQVTIPKDVFERLHLGVGDVLEAEVQQGKLILIPKMLTEKAPAPKLTAKEQYLLGQAREKIKRIRKDLAFARGLSSKEAEVAVKAGLIAEDQRWWWTEEWQKGEREAQRDLLAGRTRAFENAEQLMEDLRSQ